MTDEQLTHKACLEKLGYDVIHSEDPHQALCGLEYEASRYGAYFFAKPSLDECWGELFRQFRLDLNIAREMEKLLQTNENWRAYAATVVGSILPENWISATSMTEIIEDTTDFRKFVQASPLTKVKAILKVLEARE